MGFARTRSRQRDLRTLEKGSCRRLALRLGPVDCIDQKSSADFHGCMSVQQRGESLVSELSGVVHVNLLVGPCHGNEKRSQSKLKRVQNPALAAYHGDSPTVVF